VVDAAGKVNGVVELSGTLRAPLYRGSVDVSGGRLRLRGREETLVDLSGRLELDGDRIQFANAVGGDGGEGRLTANGTLTLRDGRLVGYDVAVELQHFAVGLSGEYHGELSGAITLKRSAAGGLPVFTGGILVHRLDYLREVGRRRGDEAGPSSWVGRFDVDLPGKAWIRNADLEVELRGQVTYERNVSGRTVLGQLETVRGRYTLFGHTFRITSGEILFTDPDDVDPELNVTAETRIPEARIFATITGRASDRQVVLTSDPDFDQASLWMMLVPSGTGEVTSFVAMTPFVSDLERTIFREIPGLSVSLEERISEPGAQPTLGVRAGTYLGSEVFFSAYQGLAESSEQDVSLEYELGRRFFLKGSVVRRGVIEPGGAGEDIEQEYNLDLNMRWEW
jgi:autotransporter translocation and assembly factor TamB